MSSSSNTSACVSSSSAQPNNHNRDGNHPHPHRERGDREPRTITPVRLGMVVSEKTVSTVGMSMTPTRFEHTQSDHALLSSSTSNTAALLHHNHNMSSSKSIVKHPPNQSSTSQIYKSSSISSKTSSSSSSSSSNYHNHSLSINKSNSNSSSNLHSHLIGDDSLSTHLLGGGAAIPSTSSPSPDAVDNTTSVDDSPSQSPPSGRIKRRSMSHSDLPSVSDIALTSSSSTSASNNKESNVAVIGGSTTALPSNSSTRGPGLGLYSGGGVHAGSKQHLLDVNWSVDPLSSSSSSAAASSSVTIQGTVPVTIPPTHTLNTLQSNPTLTIHSLHADAKAVHYWYSIS